MADETRIQFGHPQGTTEAVAPDVRRGTLCPTCAQHFPGDAKFCPFDGDALKPSDVPDRSSAALIGQVVDRRYVIERIIGEGGMGTVYAVRHRGLAKRFALKALRAELASDSDTATRFIQEARTAAAVSHPGLVEITDFGTLHTGQPYFVMELLEGSSLASVVRLRGPLPSARVVEIARQCSEALHALHTRGIIHRDLKPDNIHIGSNDGWGERVKIVDFGLARVMGSTRLTRNGVVFGTPHYMSPEQAAGETPDHRSDIYSLGVVMYEMLTGRVPFEADSYRGVLTQHMHKPPTPPSELAERKLLSGLERAVLRCLEKSPANRYSCLVELTDDLTRIQSGLERRGTRASEGVELPSRNMSQRSALRGRSAWQVAAIASLGIFALIAIAVAARSRPSAPAKTAAAIELSASLPTPSENAASKAIIKPKLQAASSEAAITAPEDSSGAATQLSVPEPASSSLRVPSVPQRADVTTPRSKRRAPPPDIIEPWQND